MVQQLRIRSNAGDAGQIPGRKAKIPHAPGQLSPRVAAAEPTWSRACLPQHKVLLPMQPHALTNFFKRVKKST